MPRKISIEIRETAIGISEINTAASTQRGLNLQKEFTKVSYGFLESEWIQIASGSCCMRKQDLTDVTEF